MSKRGSDLESTLRVVDAEVISLRVDRERLAERLAELDEQIAKRLAYLEAAVALLDDIDTGAGPHRAAVESLRPVPAPTVPLESIARSGHGSATRGVLSLLTGATEDGLSAKEIIASVRAAGFEVQDADTAVRSALKNLRKQNRVFYDKVRGRYALTELGRQGR